MALLAALGGDPARPRPPRRAQRRGRPARPRRRRARADRLPAARPARLHHRAVRPRRHHDGPPRRRTAGPAGRRPPALRAGRARRAQRGRGPRVRRGRARAGARRPPRVPVGVPAGRQAAVHRLRRRAGERGRDPRAAGRRRGRHRRPADQPAVARPGRGGDHPPLVPRGLARRPAELATAAAPGRADRVADGPGPGHRGPLGPHPPQLHPADRRPRAPGRHPGPDDRRGRRGDPGPQDRGALAARRPLPLPHPTRRARSAAGRHRAPAVSGLLLPVLYSGTFVQLMSVTVLQVAVPAVRADLGAGPGAAQLVVAGYTLTFACSLITAARLGDRYGYRRLFAMGMAVFTLAAAAGAAAPDASVLVAARLVQGLGSGLMAPQILSIVQTAVPAARRARAMAGYGATMAVASLAGPVLGGFLLELDPFGLGWRAAMALTVPVGAAALALAPALPPGGATGAGQRVDGLGACLSLSGLLLLVLPLTVGGDQGWPAWVWASLAASAALLAAFVAVQRRVAHPLVHRAALSGRTTRWGIAGILLFNAGVPSFVLLLSLHLQGALRLGPLATALTITPYAVGALLGSGLAEA